MQRRCVQGETIVQCGQSDSTSLNSTFPSPNGRPANGPIAVPAKMLVIPALPSPCATCIVNRYVMLIVREQPSAIDFVKYLFHCYLRLTNTVALDNSRSPGGCPPWRMTRCATPGKGQRRRRRAGRRMRKRATPETKGKRRSPR